jgi:glycosyltransferase involved in cell wall biosynthesis
MKILFLTRYGKQGASSRMRFLQYIPWFESAGIECLVSPLFDDAMLLRKYRNGGYSLLNLLSAYWRRICTLSSINKFDLVWVEKEALPWLPAWFERWLLRRAPYFLDFDDAIFHNYDLHRYSLVRRFYGRRIDHLMESAFYVLAGNRYLANRAIAAEAKRIEVFPTVVDLARYACKRDYSETTKLRIVWIGSPSTLCYLQEIAKPLTELAKYVRFTLRVIGGGHFSLPGVDVELVDWTIDKEAAEVIECDIGIMPLIDSPWEQGKCAYKLIQYMACGLPTVSSPVGANREVVVENETGLFADSYSDWVEKLKLLLSDVELRRRLGEAGRLRVEENYCLQKTGSRLVSLFKALG